MLARKWKFWLGLPGILFLFWAWWDSSRFDSDALMYPRGFLARNGDSQVTVTLLNYKGGEWIPPGSLGYDRNWRPDNRLFFPVFHINGDHVLGWTEIFVPHWLLILIYGTLWAGLFQVRGCWCRLENRPRGLE
jgi:hypothetical protein